MHHRNTDPLGGLKAKFPPLPSPGKKLFAFYIFSEIDSNAILSQIYIKNSLHAEHLTQKLMKSTLNLRGGG